MNADNLRTIKEINEFVNRSLDVENRVVITQDKDEREYEVHKESGAYLFNFPFGKNHANDERHIRDIVNFGIRQLEVGKNIVHQSYKRQLQSIMNSF